MTSVSTAVSCKIRNKLHNFLTQEGRTRAHLQLDQSKTKTQEYKQPSVQCLGLIIFWTPKTLGSSISLALPFVTAHVACLVGLGWLCSLCAAVPGGHHTVPASPVPGVSSHSPGISLTPVVSALIEAAPSVIASPGLSCSLRISQHHSSHASNTSNVCKSLTHLQVWLPSGDATLDSSGLIYADPENSTQKI